jgi:hypothetical protein
VWLAPSRCWLGGGLEVCLVATIQLQRRDQPLDRVALRMTRATLQLLDPVHAQPGSLGQALLCQSGREPVLPHQLAY